MKHLEGKHEIYDDSFYKKTAPGFRAVAGFAAASQRLRT